MKLQVNLLKKTRVLSEKQYQLERKIFTISILSFVVLICITIAIFAWQVFVTTQVRSIDQTIKTAESQLAGLQTASIQQLYAKSRLKLVQSLFEGRENTREALQRVLSLSIPGVTVSAIAFEKDDLLKIAVTADSTKSFDEVYSFYENTKNFFTVVVNDGVIRSTNGAYVMNLSLYTPKDNAKE